MDHQLVKALAGQQSTSRELLPNLTATFQLSNSAVLLTNWSIRARTGQQDPAGGEQRPEELEELEELVELD